MSKEDVKWALLWASFICIMLKRSEQYGKLLTVPSFPGGNSDRIRVYIDKMCGSSCSPSQKLDFFMVVVTSLMEKKIVTSKRPPGTNIYLQIYLVTK